MPAVLFQEWVRKLNSKMAAKSKRILLLIDNAPSHACGYLNMSNVRVKFLPPNTTSEIQPIDAGIIAEFKCHYRKFQLYWMHWPEMKQVRGTSTRLIN